MRTRTLAATAVLLAAATWPVSTRAQAVEEFYRGKSVTMLVGSGAGGGYDTYARIFARHMAKHIPGNPTIIAKNMPAAAGLAAASTLYTTADKDGVTVAAAGATSNTAIVPKALNALIGTKFKVIAGYDTGAGLTLAVERREAEGICGLSWSTMKASRPHWIRDKLLNIIVQMGLEKLAELPTVPAALDLVADPVKKQVLTLILIRQEPGRPVA